MPDKASVSRILPFAVYIAFIVIADLLQRGGYADLRWLYAVKVAAVLALLMVYRRSYTELSRWDLGPAAVLQAAAVGLVVWVLWICLSAGWMVVGDATGFDPREHGQIDWSLAAVRVAGAALVVPVMEELFWRSFLMRWIASSDFLSLRPASVGGKAFLVSAILFGIEHNQWLAGIVAGLAYAGLYVRSGSLWSPIVAHAVTNGLLGGWIISTGAWSYW